jgi:glycosyltransferase involved in cell wall biosynthesis
LTTGVGYDTSGLESIKRRIERAFVLEFEYDQVISVNRDHLDLLAGSHEDVAFVPNGVNLDRFDIDSPPVEGRILFIGRLVPQKRVNDLIEAYSMIAEDVPESELVIVGTGPLKAELEELADELSVDDRIRFEGHVPDDAIPKYYASADVFVLPSVWEGHPLTLLEAWAAGTPVIATTAEGVAEFVEHERTGYLVSPHSPDDLSEAIRHVLENESLARTWADNAWRLAAEEYSWKGAAEKTDRLYRQIG